MFGCAVFWPDIAKSQARKMIDIQDANVFTFGHHTNGFRSVEEKTVGMLHPDHPAAF